MFLLRVTTRFFFLRVVSLMTLYCGPRQTDAYFGLTTREPLVTMGIHDNEHRDTSPVTDHQRHSDRMTSSDVCHSLKMRARQKRMCLRGEGVGVTLRGAIERSVAQCRHQMVYERWNCSLGRHRLQLLQQSYRETAFLHAISSASLVHSLARSCSDGSLDLCTCDESFPKLQNKETWQWGGCGDNIKFALKFTKRFLRQVRTSQDLHGSADQHNTQVGIRVVKGGINETCKCHGVSGSCTVKTCWRQLTPFNEIGSRLKVKYDHAINVVLTANQATGSHQLTKKRKKTKRLHPKKGDLVYIEPSPSFCGNSSFSLGTRDRDCGARENCEVLCCGRGFNVQTRLVRKPCRCKVIWCCRVECDTCLVSKEIYRCK